MKSKPGTRGLWLHSNECKWKNTREDFKVKTHRAEIMYQKYGWIDKDHGNKNLNVTAEENLNSRKCETCTFVAECTCNVSKNVGFSVGEKWKYCHDWNFVGILNKIKFKIE